MMWIPQTAALLILGIIVLTQNLSETDKPPAHVYRHNPYDLKYMDEIDTRQQLHSKFPNFNEEVRSILVSDLNFIHTTDTHGWYAGHLNQKQYSSDWGDFVSFVHHLRESTEKAGQDLLLVDTGDRHDGNGLSDLSHVNGELSSKVFMQQNYDLVTVGNHELYVEEVSTLEFEKMVPHFGERFISTNVEYQLDNGTFVPFGNTTHRFFTTQNQKIDVFALSFLFDFTYTGNRRIRVTPIAQILELSWFTQLIEEAQSRNPDVLVIFGHIPVSHDWKELYQLHHFLRKFFPTTVIQYFGGHSHIRDFSIVDDLSTALQSGRYCETFGFLSLSNVKLDKELLSSKVGYHQGQTIISKTEWIDANVGRSYIDANLHSLMNHANKSTLEEFNTEKGLEVSNQICEMSAMLNLSQVYGRVPKNFYLEGAPYPSSDNLYHLLGQEVLPTLIPSTDYRSDNARLIIINTGSIRYDLYKGDFTQNSKFIISPFKNRWKFIRGVRRSVATQIGPTLNNQSYVLNQMKDPHQDEVRLISLLSPLHQSLLTNSYIRHVEQESEFLPADEQFILSTQSPRSNFLDYFKWNRLSYGYVTHDDFGSQGDDTVHKELYRYDVPNVIESYQSANSTASRSIFGILAKQDERDQELVDVVYYDFIEPYMFFALKKILGGADDEFLKYTQQADVYNDDFEEYNVGELLKRYVEDTWQDV